MGNPLRIGFILLSFLICTWAQNGVAADPQETDQELDRIFGNTKSEFFTTVNKLLDRHFLKSELSREDLNRITNAKDGIPHLFERIMLLAFQKRAPMFRSLIEDGSEGSMEKFAKEFAELSRDYAARFVGSLFRKEPHADFSMMLPHNRGKSTLDLVLQTLGYNAKVDLPDYPEEKRYSNAVEPDFESQWCIDAVNARNCWPVTRGEGTVVALIDSGIDPYNSLFEDRVLPGFNFLPRTTAPWSDENPPMIDYGLHGTGVATALLAVAPKAGIMPVRVHDSDTMNDPPYDYWLAEETAAGIYWAIHNGAHVISVSSRLMLAEPVISEAVLCAHEHNVVICSSAGNIPRVHLGLRPEEAIYRAFDEEVILVGGVEQRDGKIRAWPYSVPNTLLDVAAPSKDVFVLVPVYMENMKNQYVSGTSLSAPIAAGVVALMRSAAPPSRTLLQRPGAYVDLITRCLKDGARLEELGMTQPNQFVGHGLIDAFAAVKKIQEATLK